MWRWDTFFSTDLKTRKEHLPGLSYNKAALNLNFHKAEQHCPQLYRLYEHTQDTHSLENVNFEYCCLCIYIWYIYVYVYTCVCVCVRVCEFPQSGTALSVALPPAQTHAQTLTDTHKHIRDILDHVNVKKICMCVYTWYTYMHIYMYTCLCMCVCVCVRVRTHTRVYVCVCVFVYMWICIYIYTYVHKYTYTHIHTYIHVYIHIYIHTYNIYWHQLCPFEERYVCVCVSLSLSLSL